jgi:hypothetical protein
VKKTRLHIQNQEWVPSSVFYGYKKIALPVVSGMRKKLVVLQGML